MSADGERRPLSGAASGNLVVSGWCIVAALVILTAASAFGIVAVGNSWHSA